MARLAIANSGRYYLNLIDDLEEAFQEELFLNPNYELGKNHNTPENLASFIVDDLTETGFTDAEIKVVLEYAGLDFYIKELL